MPIAIALRYWPWAVAIAFVVTVAVAAQPLVTRNSAAPTAVEHVSVARPPAKGAPPPVMKAMVKVPIAYTASSARAPGGDVNARRALERSADLSLYVDDVERAVSAVSSLAETLGGDITSLEDRRPASDRDSRVADLTLDVPSFRFDEALARVAHMGVLRARTVDAQDVGNELVDDAARLRNLRRTEQDIAKIMDRSGRIAEVLDAQSQLSSVREEIEKLAAERAALAHRIDYATLDIHFEGAVVPAVTRPAVATRLAQARHAAAERFVDTFVSLAALALNVAVGLPYAAPVLALSIIAVRLVGRRRRRTS